MTRIRLLLALVCALAAAPAQAQQQRVVVDFRVGQELPVPVKFFGPDAETVATRDAEGLRINLAAGRPNADIVGLEIPRRMQGDFQVELGYELLEISEPTNGNGSGVVWRLIFDSPVKSQAQFSRLRKEGKEFLSAFHIHLKPDGKERWDGRAGPGLATRGTFRMTRTGPQFRFEAAEGGAEFAEVWATEIGPGDVTSLRLWAISGYRPTTADVRFTSLTIDAAPPPAGAVAAAPVEPEPSAPPPRRSALLLSLVLLGLLVAVAAALLLYFGRRER